MGNETILYYVFDETITGCKSSVKKHFWQKIKPRSFVMEDEDISVVIVMIPTNDKGWNRKKLLDIMNTGIAEYVNYLRTAKVVMHPEIQELIGQQESFQTVFWTLTDRLFADNFSYPHGNKQQVPESVVLMMGNFFFPEEQIERFTDMMQPYFPRINHLSIMYETYGDVEINMERLRKAIDDFSEMLYYEYGLVVDVYQSEGDVKQRLEEENAQEQMNSKKMRYMHKQLRTLYVDYGYQGSLPYSMMRAGGIYIDVLSSREKEQRIKKKCSKISYLSPMKYLDTMVKSGYDKLVN
ncbi:MAG: hypothetical protein K2K46_10595 [Lachnospiraceae bacterium]|nr:hypothetical protein [Lachnospiraceae bacterium]